MDNFSDHQIAYDNEREFSASAPFEETSNNEALEEMVCEVVDSQYFPTFEELQAFGFTRKKYDELAEIRANAILDSSRFGYIS